MTQIVVAIVAGFAFGWLFVAPLACGHKLFTSPFQAARGERRRGT